MIRAFAQRLVWSNFWVVVSVLALMLSTLVHLRLPITRYLLRSALNELVSDLVRGQLAIGDITKLTLRGLEARNVWVYDGEGRPIIRAESVRLAPDLEALWDGRIRIRSAQLSGAVVTLHDLGDSSPSLFTTFDPTTPSDSTTPFPVVTVDNIEIDGLVLQGDLLGLTGVRVERASAAGRMVIADGLDIRIDDARGELTAPYSVRPRFTELAGRISTQPTKGVRLAAQLAHDDERVALGLTYAAPTPDTERELRIGLRARPVHAQTLVAIGLDFMAPITTSLRGDFSLEGPPNRLRLSGELDGDGGHVSVDGVLDTADGYAVNLTTDGLALDRSVDGGPELTVRGRASIAKRPDELEPHVQVSLDPMQMQKLAIPAFDLSGVLSDGGLRVTALNVKRGSGTLRGSGSVRSDGSLDLRVTARVPAIERDPDLAPLLAGVTGRLEADVRVVTPLLGKRKLDFRGRIVLYNVRYRALFAKRLVLSGSARGDPELPNLALDVRGEDVRAEDYPLGNALLSVKGGPRTYAVEGQFQSAGQRTFFFASNVQASRQGLVVDADPIEFGLGNDSWRGAMSGLSITYGELVELTQLRLANRSQRLEVKGRWHEREGDSVEALLQDFDLAVIRALFGARFPLKEGRADAQLTLTGELSDPQVTLQGALRGGRLAKGPELNALYFVTYASGALELDSELDLAGRGVVRARGNARIDARASDPTVLLETALYSVDLQAEALDLPLLFADAIDAPKGTVIGSVRVQGSLSDPYVEGDVSVSRLTLPGVDALELDSRVLIEPNATEVQLVIADAGGSLGSFDVALQPDWTAIASQPDAALDRVLDGRWSVRGNLAGRRLDELPKPLNSALPLGLSGQFEVHHDTELSAYARLEGRWAEALAARDCASNVKPEVRALLTLRDDLLRYSLQVEAGEYRVATADGTLALPAQQWLATRTFSPAPSDLDMQMELDAPSTAELPFLCELGDGPLNGTVRVASALTDHPQFVTVLQGELMPRAELVGRRRRRQRVQSCSGQPIVYDIEARANASDVQTELRLAGCRGGDATVTVRAPVRWDDAMSLPAVDPQRPLSVQGRFDHAQLSPLLNRIPGLAAADVPVTGEVALSGPLTALQYSGELVLQNGSLRLVPTGQTLTGVQARLSFDKQRGVLRDVVAHDRRGKLTANGVMDFAGLVPSHLKLDVAAQSFPYKVEGVQKADLTGAAKLDMQVEPERVVVHVRLDGLRVDLPQTTGRTVQELDPNPDVRFMTDQSEVATTPYVVDLVIDGRKPITVRRNDLDAQVALELTLRYADPLLQMAGYVELRSGNFDILGKKFYVDHGALRFDPNLPGDPDVSLVATHRSDRSDNYSVTLSVRGHLSAPEITFSSLECTTPGGAFTLLVSGVCPDSSTQDPDQEDREGALAAAGVALGAISGTLGPSLSVEAEGDATRVAAGYNATVPDSLRAVVRRVYVQGGVTGAGDDTSGQNAGTQNETARNTDFDVLVKLYFPYSLVGTGTVGTRRWGLDLTWEP